MAQDNDDVAKRRKAPGCRLIVFGAGGDLVKRLLVPSLYNLATDHLLSDGFQLIGIDREDETDERWRASLQETLHSFTKDRSAEFFTPEIDETSWQWLRDRLRYVQGDFTKTETFDRIVEEVGDDNAIFYLATGSSFFGDIVDALGKARLLRQTGSKFRRLVVEKPFGEDLRSAKVLNERILHQATEAQIFRIDHFLGKEPVQNITALRLANRLFEPTWRAEFVDHVQITAAETVGVEQRGSFYEKTGALRDMLPNHLFSLLCTVAMELPSSSDPEAVRDERFSLMQAIKPASAIEAVRGQYDAPSDDDSPRRGYRDEDGVASDSTTETYVALKVLIDSKRWHGVPFYLRTGKRLADRHTMISIHYKAAANGDDRKTSAAGPQSNVVRLLIDPSPSIEADLRRKLPGPGMELGLVTASACLNDASGGKPNVGYEALLYGCMLGDTALFHRADAIETGWEIVQPLLDAWDRDETDIEGYPSGSRGPVGAEALLEVDGRHWLPFGVD